MADPIDVFLSYAPSDVSFRDELETHLAPLRREGLSRDWHEGKLQGGEHRASVIDEHLKKARVVLALISADYLASDACHAELRAALARERAGKAIVVPILIRACKWEDTELRELRTLPADVKPVKSWADRDEAWDDVVRGVRAILQRLQDPRTAHRLRGQRRWARYALRSCRTSDPRRATLMSQRAL
jgi:hypothetical protein